MLCIMYYILYNIIIYYILYMIICLLRWEAMSNVRDHKPSILSTAMTAGAAIVSSLYSHIIPNLHPQIIITSMVTPPNN